MARTGPVGARKTAGEAVGEEDRREPMRKLTLIGVGILVLVVVPAGLGTLLFGGAPVLMLGPYRGAEPLPDEDVERVDGSAAAGAFALRRVVAARGLRLDGESLRGALDGMDPNLANLQRIAREHGVVPRQWRPRRGDLRRLPTPAATVLDGSRYVVVERVEGDGRVVFVDPERGRFALGVHEFRSRWSGWALIVS